LLLWGIRSSRLPPLLTTSSTPTVTTVGGVLMKTPGVGGPTDPGTSVLFGGDNWVHDFYTGGRFTLGYWFDQCGTLGVDGTFFFLGQRGNHFVIGSPGAITPGPGAPPNLFRPFLDTTGRFGSVAVANGFDVTPGSFVATSEHRLWGLDFNLRKRVLCGCNYHVDLLGGVRYIDLTEALNIVDSEVLPGVDPRTGTLFPQNGRIATAVEHFGTRNQFTGGQIGAEAEVRRGKFFFGLGTKLALGDNHEVVNINGFTVQTPLPGSTLPTQVTPGGVLALPSNIGRRTRENVAFASEVELKVGYNITDHLRAYVAYNFLFLTNVLRPGDQIDLFVDSRQIDMTVPPGVIPTRPMVPFRETSFWAQGVNFGLEFSF
jgi:hypothetical protein